MTRSHNRARLSDPDRGETMGTRSHSCGHRAVFAFALAAIVCFGRIPAAAQGGLATDTISFQQGVGGYAGTIDTHIRQAAATTAHGALESIEWDSMEGTAGSEKFALLRFENIFGTGQSQVPPGATISSAVLGYVVWNAGDSALCNEVVVDWTEDVTYNSFGPAAGVQVSDYGSPAGTAHGSAIGTYTLNITASVAAWSANPAGNRGWIFRHTGTDGVDIRSSEYGTVAQRPVLTVIYFTDNYVPDPPVVVAPSPGATGVPLSPALTVSVADQDADTLTVTYHGRTVPASVPEDFAIIKLPDTQYYSGELNGGSNAIFKAQTQWIINNRVSRNIAYVQHVGDIVQNGEAVPAEWRRADTSISILEQDPTLPFGLCVGNHDIGSGGITTSFNQTFGVSRFSARPWYGGNYGASNDNHFILFSAEGLDFIAISLKYGTSIQASVLRWADSLLKAYPDRRAIVSSHWILEVGNPGAFGGPGQAIYDSLKDNSNLFLLLCGHRHGEGRRVDTFNGNTVHTILADYQDRPRGGDGWLRIMEFSPANNVFRVRTYSPTLGQFESDADSSSQFTIPYTMQGGAVFQNLGQQSGVLTGSSTSLPWPALAPGTTYEWYVEVSDGFSTVQGPVWTFTTEPVQSASANIRVALEGAWNGSGMNTGLAAQSLVPAIQPYDVPPWNHGGAETVSAIPSGAVDWLLLELRTGDTLVVARRAAFLKSDGAVVDLDGVSQVHFPGIPPGEYNLLVRHRNHTGVFSAATLTLSGSSVLYDFTDWSGGAKARGGPDAMRDMGGGVHALWCGDSDGNGGVGASDLVSIRTAIGLASYDRNDIDMNGGVGASDLVLTRLNIGRASAIP